MSRAVDDPTHAEEEPTNHDSDEAEYIDDADHRARVAAAIDFMIKRYQKTLDYLADK